MIYLKTTFSLLILGLLLITSFSQNGQLDPSFGIDGKVTIDLNPGSDQCRGMAVQTDGKIILSGYTQPNEQYDLFVLRLLTNGNVDTDFGKNGLVLIDLYGKGDFAKSVTVLPNSKILISALVKKDSIHNLEIIQLLDNGDLDTEFGIQGVTHVAIGEYDDPYEIVIQPNQKILVAGFTKTGDQYDFFTVRLTETGQFDSEFGNNGIVTTDFEGRADRATALALQSDGKIILGGFSIKDKNAADISLARLHPDGSLDLEFGNGGKVITDLAGEDDRIAKILIQPNKKILAIGQSSLNNDADFLLIRYNEDGSLNQELNNGHGIRTGFGELTGDAGVDAVLLDDGLIIVGYTDDGQFDFALVKHLLNGDLDMSFGEQGKIKTDFGEIEQASCLALQSEGKLLVAGYTYKDQETDIAIARYLIGTNVNLSAIHTSFDLAMLTPNPTTSEIKIDLSFSEKGYYNLFVMDYTGKILYTHWFNQPKSAGIHQETLQLKGILVSGTYYLVLSNNTTTKTKQFIYQ